MCSYQKSWGLKSPIGIFDQVCDRMQIKDKSKALVIGDSLTSDIRGGNNAGMDTCWYNPGRKEVTEDVRISFEISDLRELLVDKE